MPRRVILLSSVLLMFMASPSSGQDVARAYCGKDGKAHVLYRGGAARTLAAEPKQVGCERITVAVDTRTVGWSVLVENCCTSYSIPTSVIVYRNGKQAIISPGQMVWDWRFVGEGERIAVLSGPVHGEATAAHLYDAQSGKTLASWAGKGTAPNWATGWQEQLAKRE
jgi:hypothetical protein